MNKLLLCFSTSDWQKPWGSKQHMAKLLSQNFHVIYIGHQYSFLHLVWWGNLFKRKKRCDTGDVEVIYPPPLIPFGNYIRSVNFINQWLLFLYIKGIVSRRGYRNVGVAWIYTPIAVDIVRFLKPEKVVFHCIADFSGEKNNPIRQRTLSLMEKELARRSDVILAMTQELLRRYKNINVNTHLFPSAVDYEMFRKYLDGNLRLPHDMADIKKPRIGILGYLDANILDLDLLTYLSERHSSWSFVVIGPKHKKTRELDKFLRRKNVHYLGEKKHEAAPLYLRFIDIGLIPYKVNNFTVNVSPLKLYEYLSLGKPVVSTSLPDLAQYGKIISLSENRDEFEGAIRRILNEKKDRKSWERIEIARNNSWQKRYERVKELLDITDKKQ